MTDEYVTLMDPMTGQTVHGRAVNLKDLVAGLNMAQKQIAKGIEEFGRELEQLKTTLKDWEISLDWDPLTTETEYTVRPIAIKKGGWGRCYRKLPLTYTTCESQQDTVETM